MCSSLYDDFVRARPKKERSLSLYIPFKEQPSSSLPLRDPNKKSSRLFWHAVAFVIGLSTKFPIQDGSVQFRQCQSRSSAMLIGPFLILHSSLTLFFSYTRRHKLCTPAEASHGLVVFLSQSLALHCRDTSSTGRLLTCPHPRPCHQEHGLRFTYIMKAYLLARTSARVSNDSQEQASCFLPLIAIS